jgi:hypothetical protein
MNMLAIHAEVVRDRPEQPHRTTFPGTIARWISAEERHDYLSSSFNRASAHLCWRCMKSRGKEELQEVVLGWAWHSRTGVFSNGGVTLRRSYQLYIKLLISLPHAFIAIPSCLIHLRQAATVTPVIHIKPNAKMAPIAAANIHHNAAFLFMRPTTHFFAALILVVGVFR